MRPIEEKINHKLSAWDQRMDKYKKNIEALKSRIEKYKKMMIEKSKGTGSN